MLNPVKTATTGLTMASNKLAAASVQIGNLGAAPALLPDAPQLSLSDAAIELAGTKTGFSINLAVCPRPWGWSDRS